MSNRPTRSEVHKFFVFLETKNEYKCNIVNCNVTFKNKHAGTFKAHLKRLHPKEYGEVLQDEYSIRQEKVSNVNEKIKLNIIVSPEELRKSFINLVTIHGRPFSLMEDSAFREIIDPILDALPQEHKFNVSRKSVYDMVKVSAAQLRQTIAEELKDVPLVSLKMDIGTRHSRSFLGINIQFIKNGDLHLRTLAVKEIFTKHTSTNLKDIVVDVLNDFDISVSKLYTFTSDSGSNMIKLNSLLQEDQEFFAQEHWEIDSEDEDENENEDAFSKISTLDILTGVKCGVHRLQLAVLEVLRNGSMSATIAKAREVVKNLRKDSCLKSLKILNIRKPVLDVVTRWNSTADMLDSLLKAKEFCKDVEENMREMHLTSIEWERVEQCLAALMPCKKATLRMQDENLLPGDFFIIWKECKMRTAEIKTSLAEKLTKAIEKREKDLLDNDSLLASLYLDPRYLSFLPPEKTSLAKETLINLWKTIQRLNGETTTSDVESTTSEDTSLANTSTSSADDDYFQILSLERNRLDAERLQRPRVEETSIEKLLEDFEKVSSIPFTANLLHYWESQKSQMPQLYVLSKIVHATPMTQVSVERLFSGMRFILSTLRANLSHDIVDDILLLRTNHLYTKKHEDDSSQNNKKQKTAEHFDLESCRTTQLMTEESELF